MKIKRVIIDGLLDGEKNIYLDLKDNVNILAGHNGSEKTETLHNIIGVLKSALEETIFEPHIPVTGKIRIEFNEDLKVVWTPGSIAKIEYTRELHDAKGYITKNLSIFNHWADEYWDPDEIIEEVKQNIKNYDLDLKQEFFQDIFNDKNFEILEVDGEFCISKQDINRLLKIDDLSIGELLLLLIMTRPGIDQNGIYVLDTPEFHICLDYQYELIDNLQKYYPNLQLILSTHSPSLLGKEWGNTVIHI